MGYNSILNMGRKSLDIDYKSLFTKNLKIMSFTFWLQNYEKYSQSKSLGVSPRIKTISRQKIRQKTKCYILKVLAYLRGISYKSQPTALAPSTAAELPSSVETKNLALPLKIFNTLLS